MKFDTEVFSKITLEKFKFFLKLTRVVGTLHEDLHTFMIITLSAFT